MWIGCLTTEKAYKKTLRKCRWCLIKAVLAEKREDYLSCDWSRVSVKHAPPSGEFCAVREPRICAAAEWAIEEGFDEWRKERYGERTGQGWFAQRNGWITGTAFKYKKKPFGREGLFLDFRQTVQDMKELDIAGIYLCIASIIVMIIDDNRHVKGLLRDFRLLFS